MMNDLLLYVLKVSGVFSLLTFVYYLLFRRLTFHALNRVVLLSIVLLSLILSLLNFNIPSPMIQNLPELEPIDWGEGEVSSGLLEITKPTPKKWGLMTYIGLTYGLGLIVSMTLLVRNAIQLFHRLRRSDKLHSLSYTLCRSEGSSIFSCMRWIFIPEDYVFKPDDPIIQHEKAHIQLFHSVDLVITELFKAFTWFNPFVFLFRKMLRSVHEFQADERVLSFSIKKSEYLTLMLESLTTTNPLHFSSSFKSSTIKNRIEMITKNKSRKRFMLNYSLLVPVTVIILMAFSNPHNKESELKTSIPSIMPMKEGDYHKITSEFGMRKHPHKKEKQMHQGIDMSADIGSPVYATGNGWVFRTKTTSGKDYGNLVRIWHGDGYATFYCHLDDFVVKRGDFVKKGQLIGHSGNTGWSTGPHLHYAVIHDDEFVNPKDYFTE